MWIRDRYQGTGHLIFVCLAYDVCNSIGIIICLTIKAYNYYHYYTLFEFFVIMNLMNDNVCNLFQTSSSLSLVQNNNRTDLSCGRLVLLVLNLRNKVIALSLCQ